MGEPSKLDRTFHMIMRRMDLDWVSHSREYVREMITTMIEIGKTGPFWHRPK